MKASFRLTIDGMNHGTTRAMDIMEAIKFAVGYVHNWLDGTWGYYHNDPTSGVLSIAYLPKGEKLYRFFTLTKV